MAELSERHKRSTDYYMYDPEWGDSFNYLTLGNSLTLIESWGRGICSTQPDNDYFGLVLKDLEKRNDKVSAYHYNYHVWERSSDRDFTLDMTDEFLDPSLDLVTIQLGENSTDISTYHEDLTSLVEYTKTAAPNAQIIIIDNFWSAEKSDIRQSVAEQENISFVEMIYRARKNFSQKRESYVSCLMEVRLMFPKKRKLTPVMRA